MHQGNNTNGAAYQVEGFVVHPFLCSSSPVSKELVMRERENMQDDWSKAKCQSLGRLNPKQSKPCCLGEEPVMVGCTLGSDLTGGALSGTDDRTKEVKAK